MRTQRKIVMQDTAQEYTMVQLYVDNDYELGYVPWATVYMENEAIRIEIYEPEPGHIWDFDFKEMIEGLERAKSELLEAAK